ncbi:DUF354 domain-containing protein [Sphingorhabdus sp.]|uniref:DUF354 domain-containing protein n=1 Tax=Sphingorhabdus sp. TaxID=1902408 RepID=UPI0035B24E67
MRILFDLVHPADALFFHHSIKKLATAGHEVHIASRQKDVLLPLLDGLHLPHQSLSNAGAGLAGLAVELAVRDARLFCFARHVRPDIMVGFGGVAIAHIGKLLGIPSIGFYDTEHAGLQLALTLPFISEWHVPVSWQGREAKGRTYRFQGSKQMAYLHPQYFKPDNAIARLAGLDEDRDNFLVRIVAWQANHDSGRSGISDAQLDRLVAHLGSKGKVHISAEGALPAHLEALRFRGDAVAFHHLLAHCQLYCGESITVASEAVMLGVPALLQIDKEYCYITEQENAGLIRRFDDAANVVAAIDGLLAEDPAKFRERAYDFALGLPDLNHYIVNTILRAGNRKPANP